MESPALLKTVEDTNPAQPCQDDANWMLVCRMLTKPNGVFCFGLSLDHSEFSVTPQINPV